MLLQTLCRGKRDHPTTNLRPHDLYVVVGNEVELEARGTQWDRVTLGSTLRLTEFKVYEDIRTVYDNLEGDKYARGGRDIPPGRIISTYQTFGVIFTPEIALIGTIHINYWAM